MRESFPQVKAIGNGSIITLVKLRDVDELVKKPMSTILSCARNNEPELLELNKEDRSLPVYVDFKSSPVA